VEGKRRECKVISNLGFEKECGTGVSPVGK